MAAFEPVLSRNWNVAESHTLKVYESRGGYQAARKALASDPDSVVTLVKDSELRGRGGAGFPCGLKWTFLPKDRKETLMCINADESEPATFNNRLLMEKDPHQLLEGILIACFATKATTAYLYLRFEYIRAYQILEAAIDEARAAGHLGQEHLRHRLQSGRLAAPRRRRVYLRRGNRLDREPGRETGLAADQAAVSGHRRRFSQADGRQQRRDALLRAPHHRARSELVQIDRHTQELRTEALLRFGPCEQAGLRRAAAGYHLPRLDRRARRRSLEGTQRPRPRCRAGSAWACCRPSELDTPLDFESLRKPGCLGLGTAAVTVIDDQTEIVDYLYNTCRFFAHESCGQCTPCREGTTWFYKTMKRIKAGGGRLEDLDIMLNLANNMGIIPGTTICGLADGAAWPIKNAIAKFRARAGRVHSQPPECRRTNDAPAREHRAWHAAPDCAGLLMAGCRWFPSEVEQGQRASKRQRQRANGNHHHQ